MSQPLEALSVANQRRLERAGLRSRIEAGEVCAADVFDDPPACVQRTAALKVLGWQPLWGAARSRQLVHGLHVADHKFVCELSDRQRAEIAARVRRWKAAQAARKDA